MKGKVVVKISWADKLVKPKPETAMAMKCINFKILYSALKLPIQMKAI